MKNTRPASATIVKSHSPILRMARCTIDPCKAIQPRLRHSSKICRCNSRSGDSFEPFARPLDWTSPRFPERITSWRLSHSVVNGFRLIQFPKECESLDWPYAFSDYQALI